MMTNASAAAHYAAEAKRFLALAQRDAEQGVTPETQDYMSQAGLDLAFLREQLGVSFLQHGPVLGIDAAELENLLAGSSLRRDSIRSTKHDQDLLENFQAGVSCAEDRMEAVQVAANKPANKPAVKAPKVKTPTVAASKKGIDTKKMTLGQVRILQYLATLGKGAATTAAIVDAGCCGRNIFSGYVTSAAPAGSNSYMTTNSLLTQGYVEVIPSNGEVAKCFKITPVGKAALKEALKNA